MTTEFAAPMTATIVAAAPAPDLIPCPVPGCEQPPMRHNALGPHLAMHRRKGDPGTPPAKVPTKGGKPGRPRKNTAAAPPRKPRTPPKLEPGDIADGVIAVLFPDGIPRDKLRSVLAWTAETDRLATEALAAQQTP